MTGPDADQGVDHDRAYMALALAQARQGALAGEVPVGAVLVRAGQVIAAAHNAPVSLCDPTAHAEVRVLREAAQRLGNYRLTDCTLYVTAEPCAMCAGAIFNARLRRVVYGVREPRTGAAGSQVDLFAQPALNPHTELHGGVGADEAQALLREFFARRRAQAAQARTARLREDALRPAADACRAGGAAQGWTADWRDGWHLVPDPAAPEGALPWQLHAMHGGSEHPAAPLAVLVHGWGDDGRVWRLWAQALAAQGWRVLVPDLPGHGLSDRPRHAQALPPARVGALLRHWLQRDLGWVDGPGAGRTCALAIDASVAPLWAGWIADVTSCRTGAAPVLWVQRPSLAQRALPQGALSAVRLKSLRRPLTDGYPHTLAQWRQLRQLTQEITGYAAVSDDGKKEIDSGIDSYPDDGHLVMVRAWVQALRQADPQTQAGSPEPSAGAGHWQWTEGASDTPEPAAGPMARGDGRPAGCALELPASGGQLVWSAALARWWQRVADSAAGYAGGDR